jgi:hypothetical protein
LGGIKRKEIAVPKTSEAKLTGDEWQARFNIAAAQVQREYCEIFKFWRGCRYKPCRRFKACGGDPLACLTRGTRDVPYDLLSQAELQVRTATPADLTGPERSARNLSPTAWSRDRARPK